MFDLRPNIVHLFGVPTCIRILKLLRRYKNNKFYCLLKSPNHCNCFPNSNATIHMVKSILHVVVIIYDSCRFMSSTIEQNTKYKA